MNRAPNNPLITGDPVALAQIGSSVKNIWGKISLFFVSYQWKEIIFTVKTISIGISVILFFLIIVVIIKANTKARIRSSVSGAKKPINLKKGRIFKKWLKIEKKLGTNIEANYKLSVLEADKIFNEILKIAGYEAEIKISNLTEIKQYSKIKNNIIEDSSFGLNEDEARKIVNAYRKGLEDLGVI